MALITCPDCSKAISDSATSCPHCGRPQKPVAAPSFPSTPRQPRVEPKKSGGCLLPLLVVLSLPVLAIGGFLVFVIGLDTAKKAGIIATPTPVPLSADEQRLGPKPGYCPGRYLKVVGALRGESAPPCVVEMYLSKALKDPSSFKMEALCPVAAGDSAWVATCTYRARNSFGGYNVSTTDFSIKDGRLVDVKER